MVWSICGVIIFLKYVCSFCAKFGVGESDKTRVRFQNTVGNSLVGSEL